MKYIFFSIICLLCLASCNQVDPEIKYYIDSWKVATTDQTNQAEKTYYKMRQLPEKEIQIIISKCHEYLEKSPNERIRLRLAIFEALAIREPKATPDSNDYKNVAKILPDCLKYGDNQITAELYAILSDYSSKSRFIPNVLKANEMMEVIGFQYFPRYKQRLYNIAFTLYLNQEYRQSLKFLNKATSISGSDMDFLFNPAYVLANDLTAACYDGLEMRDSSIVYYKLLLQNLELTYNTNYKYVPFWRSITLGNIAYQMALKGNFDLAMPYILKHKEAALADGNFHNVSITENRLAEIYLMKGDEKLAIKHFHNAINLSKKSNFIKQRKIAARGLVEIYKVKNNTDSVYKYFELYKVLEDSINIANLAYNLGTAEARVAYESSESNLDTANKDIKQQRLLRNFIIIFILLLSIIAYQFYSRSMMEQRSKTARLESDKYQALNDVEKAKEEIHMFKHRIIEKEALISKLHSHILDKDDIDPEVDENVIKYTLIDKDEMDKFNFEFEIAHPTVMPRLDNVSKPLSPAERRLAALIYLQLNNEQIGHALGISKDSVARSKRRLKQTLNLTLADNLEDFILGKRESDSTVD